MDSVEIEFTPPPAQQALPSLTELPNPLTTNMDIADPEGIVRLLRQVDAQIINGYADFPAIADREMLDRLSHAVDRIIEILDRRGRSRLVLSGAGTSGRLAMLTAREVNRFLSERGREPIAHFTMAGGSAALIRAEEGAEDLPKLGRDDLQRVIAGAHNVVYIGITCGLSAAYIAGQLDAVIDRPNTLCILLGFTTLARARTTPIEGWNQTFAEVAQRIDDDPRHILLTPVVGPEAITGSTRMKSGTATGIILQLLMFCAFSRYGVLRDDEASAYGARVDERVLDSLRRFLLDYETARNCAYLESDHLAAVIEEGGVALRAGRHIYYLGSGNPGILGLIDASECPPTFGASFHDVRGFLEGGWSSILPPGETPPPPTRAVDSALFRFGLDAFEDSILGDVTAGDLVIGLGDGRLAPDVWRLMKASRERGAKLVAILMSPAAEREWLDVDIYVPLTLPSPGYIEGGRSFAEMSLKLLLNGITTGAHVLAGKVYQNFMIDLRITNSKLYTRALNMVARLMKVSNQHAEAALLSSIYETDSLNPQLMSAPVSAHVATAGPKSKVVPRAMLIATGRFGVAEASEALGREPVVRQLLEQYLR